MRTAPSGHDLKTAVFAVVTAAAAPPGSLPGAAPAGAAPTRSSARWQVKGEPGLCCGDRRGGDAWQPLPRRNRRQNRALAVAGRLIIIPQSSPPRPRLNPTHERADSCVVTIKVECVVAYAAGHRQRTVPESRALACAQTPTVPHARPRARTLSLRHTSRRAQLVSLHAMSHERADTRRHSQSRTPCDAVGHRQRTRPQMRTLTCARTHPLPHARPRTEHPSCHTRGDMRNTRDVSRAC